MFAGISPRCCIVGEIDLSVIEEDWLQMKKEALGNRQVLTYNCCEGKRNLREAWASSVGTVAVTQIQVFWPWLAKPQPYDCAVYYGMTKIHVARKCLTKPVFCPCLQWTVCIAMTYHEISILYQMNFVLHLLANIYYVHIIQYLFYDNHP